MITLDSLAIKHGTDKSSKHHNYCPTYEIYFQALRDRELLLFEVGVGGYKFSNKGGESLMMWREYFPNARIITIDLYNKSNVFCPPNAEIHQCSQTDQAGIENILMGRRLDVVIDDGSHINPLTIDTFDILFPYLKSGGYYIIEDTHTSYWKDIATDGTDFKGGNHEGTLMNHFKKLCDEINLVPEIQIRSIHFYKQMIVILKK